MFAKFTGKQLWFAKFSRTRFYRTPLDDRCWLFPATLLKWDIANSLETLTLEVPVRYIISFLAASTFSVCFHWFALFTPRSSHQNRGVLKNFCKFHRETPVMESLFNKVASLTPILKNICQQLLLHYSRTSHCYLSVLLYIQHLLPHITAYL